MLPARYTSGDKERICPYDNTHIILAKSYNAHLLKCRRNHKDVPMVVCRFDKTHLIHKPEKAHHESECPSQYLLDRERQKLAGDSGLRGDVSGPPIIADHNTAIDNEDWGSCAPVRTPALFNKLEPRENFIGPYMPAGSSQFQGNHVIPQTSSMAAGMVHTSKQKVLPSEVFQYTSSYGRGRGKINAPNKPAAQSSVHPSMTVPEKGQFEDIASEGDINHGQPNAHKGNLIQSAPQMPSTVTLEKEREQFGLDQLQQLKQLHQEQHEKFLQEQELQRVQLEKEFAKKRQELVMKQEEDMRLLEERLRKYQLVLAAAASTSPAPPPGLKSPELSGSAVSDIDVLNKTIDPALRKENNEEEESWHQESNGGAGLNFCPAGTSGPEQHKGLVNSIGLTGSHNMNHVTNWLSKQHIDDIDDPGALAAGAESPSESIRNKRKLEKKLRQINLLEQKVSLGHRLSQAEEDKLNKKADIISQLSALDCILP